MRLRCVSALAIALLGFVGTAHAQLTFINALCSTDETAVVVARTVSEFAVEKRWRQTTAPCASLESAVAQLPGGGGAVILTSYSAVARLQTLRVLNPHLIAYPTYVLSANTDVLRKPGVSIGYAGGPLHIARLQSALLAARGNLPLTIREYGDSLQMLSGLKRGEVAAVVVVGDDPGASLSRMTEAFRQTTSTAPSVILLEADAGDLGQLKPANLGDTKYLLWTWSARPLVRSSDLPQAGGNALLEVVRSISTVPLRHDTRAGGGWVPARKPAEQRRQRVETTLDDLPVLLSTPNALSATLREDLGRALANAYMLAAYVAVSSGVDDCRKDYAESAPAAYLLNAFLENQSDSAASCALWAHYELTAPTAQRRANKLNAAWLRSLDQGRACQRVAVDVQAAGACKVSPEKSFQLGKMAPFDHATGLLTRGLAADASERSRLLSEARACLVEAVKFKAEPTCRDPQYRGSYEPYLPLFITIAADQLRDALRPSREH